MIRFNLPSLAELDRMGSKERLNLFRQYFSASRYNRLIIQQCLIKSAFDESFISKVKELEALHNKDFIDKVSIVKEPRCIASPSNLTKFYSVNVTGT